MLVSKATFGWLLFFQAIDPPWRAHGHQGFPPDGEIPEKNRGLVPLHFNHSMQSSNCIPRAEETTRYPENSNINQHPNEV
jgi:hypothetical protein